MPRNGSGTYTLPGGNPVEPNTVIEADWANTTLEDIADELTNSLSRNGNGGMLAPFRLFDGNASAPGLSFLLETTSGFYRPTAGELWCSMLGTPVFRVTVNGLALSAGKTFIATNVSGVVAPANGGLGATDVPTNGQVPIGNGTTYTPATITGGAGISIANGPGTITVSAANSQGLPTLTVVTGTSETAQQGFNYALTNAAATTLTLPATPTAGDLVWVTSANGRADNVVARNGNLIKGVASNLLLTNQNVQLQYVSAGYGWAEITPVAAGVESFIVQAFGIL